MVAAYLMVHVSIWSVVSSMELHQNNLLLSRQEVVVVLLHFWFHDCPDDAQLLRIADTVDRLVHGLFGRLVWLAQ